MSWLSEPKTLTSMRESSYEYIIPAVLALALTLGLIRFIHALSTRYLSEATINQFNLPGRLTEGGAVIDRR